MKKFSKSFELSNGHEVLYYISIDTDHEDDDMGKLHRIVWIDDLQVDVAISGLTLDRCEEVLTNEVSIEDAQSVYDTVVKLLEELDKDEE